jgi:1-acyl-sn-glycerol-3-phosphate acyltransferase
MDRLFFRVRLAVRMTLLVLSTALCLLAMELNLLVSRRPRIETVNRWVPLWARLLLWIFRVRLRVAGPYLEDGTLYPGAAADGVGRIFVMNHRSGVDIPVALSRLAAHAISRHDLATWPLIGLGARRIGTLFVDRTSRRSGADVLMEVDGALDRGEGVLMFPEGTVHPGDEVHRFRPGAFKAAERAGAEIVPVGIAYGEAGDAFEAADFVEHMKRIVTLPRLDVAMITGEPLAAGHGFSAVEVRDLLRERVQELVGRARSMLATQ